MQKVTEPTPEFSGNASQIDFDRKAPAAWQEAIECDVAVPAAQLGALETAPLQWAFAFPAKEESEPVRDAAGRLAEMVLRKQESLYGTVEAKATRVADGIFKVGVRGEKPDAL